MKRVEISVGNCINKNLSSSNEDYKGDVRNPR